MRTIILAVALLASVAAPSALADGADVAVDWLEGGGDCSGGGWSDGNWSEDETGSRWWYGTSTWSSCYDDHTYAAGSASTDDGDAAGGSASAHENSSLQVSDHGSGSSRRGDGWTHDEWYSSRSDSSSEAWSREVSADAAGVGVDATRGCASRHEASGSTSSWSSFFDGPPAPTGPEASGGSSSHFYRSSASRCADGVAASSGGRVAEAARVDRCEGESQHSSWSRWHWGDTGGNNDWWSSERESSSCFAGAEARLDETKVSAGRVDGCTSEGSASGGSAGEWSSRSSQCRGGWETRGPDGAVVFLGTESRSTSWCSPTPNGTECDEWGTSATFASVDWRHNPLGPSPLVVPIAHS